ncbi:MAG: amino acid ABC transporter permease [Coriobacteriales bacterium]|nr:amino acid ABC transporter permease [Coriobacteriales bacterium]
MTKSATARIAQLLLTFVVAFVVASFFALVALAPLEADALTVKRTTASSNESAGNNIIGGEPTRVTWEAVVADNEEIASLNLKFPEGCSLADDASARVTVIEGTKRVDTLTELPITADEAVINFSDPVPSGMILRVEVYHICLPAFGGTYSLTGSYVDGKGVERELEASPTITVIGMPFNQALIKWLGDQSWVQWWNSFTFCKIFLNPQVAAAAIPNTFIGWLRSLGLVLVGFPLAIPIGLGIAFLRMSTLPPLRFVASIYVNVIRGTPLFLQIYIAFFGLPLLGLKVDEYLLGILVLAMNSSAYLGEIFRAGIQSIHKGQFEAAASLGMNKRQTMFSVIIPQTIRRVIPTATSEFILLYKDTSLLAAVGVMEQMMFAKTMVATTGNMTPYMVAAGYYLIVTLPLTRIISTFEKRLAAAEGQDAPDDKAKGKKKARRVGLFKTTVPTNTIDTGLTAKSDPDQHSSQ